MQNMFSQTFVFILKINKNVFFVSVQDFLSPIARAVRSWENNAAAAAGGSHID